MMTKTIAQIVVDDYRTAAIFKKHGIDFCCGGKITLAQACVNKDVDKERLLEEIEELQKDELGKNDAKDMEMDVLCEHIVKTHHSYVRKRLPETDPFLNKLVRVHGDKHPELRKVQENFQAVKEELLSHMEKEEKVLFPFIKELVEAKKKNTQPTLPFFGTIKNPIAMMEQEHESAGDAFKEIRDITNNLTPPEDACNTYRVTFSMLDEFENDLHKHIHLENNILFPKAIELEEQIQKR